MDRSEFVYFPSAAANPHNRIKKPRPAWGAIIHGCQMFGMWRDGCTTPGCEAGVRSYRAADGWRHTHGLDIRAESQAAISLRPMWRVFYSHTIASRIWLAFWVLFWASLALGLLGILVAQYAD
jgi:hypothetical protein